MRRAFTVALVFCLIPPALAAEALDEKTRSYNPLETLAANKYESVHFTMYSQSADDAYARVLLDDLEKHFSILQKEFWDFIPADHRESHAVLLAFDDVESFDSFSARDAGLPHGQKGYLNLAARRMALLRQDSYYKDLMIAVHELVHVFNSFCAPGTPVWLDEGMAQFYANFASEKAGNPFIRGGVNFGSLKVIDALLKESLLPSLIALFTMDDGTFYGSASRSNFAAAWALVFYLRRGLGTDSDRLFTDYYALVARGVDDVRAVTRVYGDNLAAFETAWLSFLDNLYRRLALERPPAPGAVTAPDDGDEPLPHARPPRAKPFAPGTTPAETGGI